MSARKGGRRGCLLPLLLAVVAILVVVAIVIGWFIWDNGRRTRPPGPAAPPPSSTSQRPSTQPADCPDVQVLVVPGTWESASNDDPKRPRFNPRSLMLKVSTPLSDAYDDGRADVYTVPYVAQFNNPIAFPPQNQRSYDSSRDEGAKRLLDKVKAVNAHCPLTGFVLMGFSQGAVIAGDLAAKIGTGDGPIADDLLLGTGLIADGRRVPGQAVDVAPSPPGSGAEVTLGGLPLPGGITLTGPRPGGFGKVRGKVVTICAKGDLICDSTTGLGGIGGLVGAINNPIHAEYNTTKHWVSGGKPATRWLTDWARGVIDKAKRQPHS